MTNAIVTEIKGYDFIEVSERWGCAIDTSEAQLHIEYIQHIVTDAVKSKNEDRMLDLSMDVFTFIDAMKENYGESMFFPVSTWQVIADAAECPIDDAEFLMIFAAHAGKLWI